MYRTTLDNTHVERLKSILSERYGKTLSIRQLSDISAMKNFEDSYVKGSDLHIPIQMNGNFLGTAVVASINDLTGEGKRGVTELVKMILEPALQSWYLDQKEYNLRELSRIDLELDNVRVFGDSNTKEDDVEDELLKLITENQNSKANLISHIVHFEGQNSNTNKKAALALHELTGRWAFVPFNDIKGQLHSSQDLARMGNMTIYIEELSELNASEQELLLEYVEIEHYTDEPLIITTSLCTHSELKQKGLLPYLLDEVEVNTFEVDRAPLQRHSLKEVLELFFLRNSDN